MPRPLLRLGQYLLIAVMFTACGGHWMALQCVAWAGMIAEYSRTADVSVAVEKTFDGRHPCSLCTEIQKRKGEEQKRELKFSVQKLELFYAAVHPYVIPTTKPWFQPCFDCFSELRAERPASPPPRFLEA